MFNKGAVKLFALIFVFFFCISFASAFDFDNVKGYDKLKEKITVTNAFGLGGELAEYTLTANTDQCLVNCYAEGTATLYSPDKIFSDLKFKGSKIKSYKIYIATDEISYKVKVNDYESICNEFTITETNSSNDYNIGDTYKICNDEKVGTHNEVRTKPNWKEYNFKKVPAGKYKWRIEGVKKSWESVDWVGSAFGEEFTEWAWWIGVEPSAYWKFNEGTLTTAVDEIAGYNMSYVAGGTVIAGKLNNAVLVAGSTDSAWKNSAGNAAINFGTNNFTIAFWINATTSGEAGSSMIGSSSATWDIVRAVNGAGTWSLRLNGAYLVTTGNVGNNEWRRIVFVREGTGTNEIKAYVDGSEVDTGTSSHNVVGTSKMEILNGGSSSSAVGYDDMQIFNGYAWSPDDVTEDWNDGDGKEADDVIENPYFSTIPDNATINYTQELDVDFVGVNVDTWFINDTDNFQINQSGTLRNASSNLAVGTYNINVSINNTDNIFNSTIYQVVVNQADPSNNMIITGTTPIEYPTTSDFSPSETNIGDDGCSYSMTPSNDIFGAGTTTFNYSTSGCANYTSGSVTKDLIVNQNTSLTLGITGTTPITYGTITDVAGSDCPLELTCTLDKTNIVYGAGTETFNYSTSGNTNYSTSSITKGIVINKDIPSASLTSDLGWIINETQEVTIGFSESQTGDGDVTYLVYRDNVSKGSGETWTPSAGIYYYVVNTTGGQNWTENISMDTQTLTVNDVFFPQVEFTSPANNSNFTDALITLNISIVESSPDTCLWSSNSFSTNNSIACGNNITRYWNQGINVVDFWINDTAGNSNQTSITFNVDSTNLVSPVDNFESDTFDVEFNCNFSSASIKNVSILTNVSGSLIPNQTTTISGRYGDEYYLVIEADALDETAVEVNDVIVTQVQSNAWKINSTSTDDNLSRAKILGTLYYGVADGSRNERNPRILNITNISSIVSTNIIDANTSVYMISTNGSGGANSQYRQNITFTNPSENYISSWSNLIGRDSQNNVWWIMPSIKGTTCPAGNFNCGISTWSSEIGTDRNVDESNDISGTISGYTGDDPGGQELSGRLLLMVKDGTAQSSTPELNAMSNYEIEFIDFQNDYSIPKIIYEDTQNSINEFWTITITEPTLWTCQMCDDNDDCFDASENRTVLLNLTAPIINLDEPRGEIDSFAIGDNLSINWTVTDTNLDKCWFEYNDVNTSVTCSDNSTSFTPVLDFQNLTFYANDTLGNSASNFTSWTYLLLEINQTFNNPVIELSDESFELFMHSSETITQTLLNYNGTDYVSTLLSLGDGLYQITTTLQIPSFDENSNVTFFYNISISSVSGIITQSQTQEVRILNVGNCTAFDNLLMNLSLFDEKSLESINGTIEFDLEILNPSDESVLNKLSTIFEDVDTTSVCSDLNVSAGNYVYSLELRYFSEAFNSTTFSHVPEFYHIQKADVSGLPQVINLYDLAVNESTEFTIFYRDNNYLARENVLLQIQRKYVDEGIFRVIEIPITSSEGLAVGHFDLNNYKYKITVTEDGEVLNVFDNPSIRCESELSGICEIRLKGSAPTPSADFVSDLENFYYTISQTNSSVIVDFSIPTGESKTVNIEMIQTSAFADPVTICNQSILSSAGQIECDITASIGDSEVDINIVSDGNPKGLLKATFQEDLNTSFLLNNYFIGAIMLITLILMFVSSPQLMIGASVFGLVFLGLIFILKSSTVGIALGAIAWLIVASVIILSKLNKKAEQ